ncbi:ABC transporter permease subunit [Tessaracoccus sp. Y1736]
MTVDLQNPPRTRPATGTGQPPVHRRLPAGRVVALTTLAVVTVVAIVATHRLVQAGSWLGVTLVAGAIFAVLAVYGGRKRVPMKYLLPGLLLLLALQIWPVAYTVATAFTNYGDGHRVTKEEAIDLIIASSVREIPGQPRYQLAVAVPDGADPLLGELLFLLRAPSGELQVGDGAGLEPLPAEEVTVDDGGRVVAAEGYTVLSAQQVNARSEELSTYLVPVADGVSIKQAGLTEAYQSRTTITYDPTTDRLTDTETGTEYIAEDARFVAADGSGRSFPQGWKENVGLANFERVLTDPALLSGFVGIFTWNLAFAALSVISTFALGLLLALLFNDPGMRGQRLYRSLLILPYALPGFVTALVWASMYNQEFGLINNLTGLGTNWLGDSAWAKVAVLVTNLWLGFPYMFLVCTGALQSIPAELREAAMIDGASPWRMLRSVTLPLLLVAVGPLLIASFAFNFNNFGLIYLLTGGGPFQASDPTQGGTDLLITYAFRLAFGSTEANFGFASAISIFIFAIVSLLSVSAFRRTAALEEVH